VTALHLDFFAVAATLYGLYLNGRQDLRTWPVWIMSNVLWIAHWVALAYDGTPVQWWSIVMNLVLFVLNVQGWILWRRMGTGRTPERQLDVTST
jgi:hypothetical protein